MRLGLSSWEGLAADFVGGHDSLEELRMWVPNYRRMAWASGLEAFELSNLAPEYAERYRAARRSHYRLFS